MSSTSATQFPIFAAQPQPFHYLDNAATGQICQAAAEALWRFETTARANVKRGVYRLADEATTAFQRARASRWRPISAPPTPSEIVFTSGCTLALNTAAHALAPRLRPGDEILISELEHHSNIVPWQMAAERAGARMRAIPVTEEGRLAYDRLDELVSRTHPHHRGHPRLQRHRCRDRGRPPARGRRCGGRAPRAGRRPDARRTGRSTCSALGCDLYAFSAHKMFGPTGAGVLWGRKELLAELPPFLGGGEMIRRVEIERSTYAPPPHRFEAGTPPIGAAIGMGAAAAWLATLDWAGAGPAGDRADRAHARWPGHAAGRAGAGPAGHPGAPRRGVVHRRRRPSARCLPAARRGRRLPARRPPLRPAADGRVRPAGHRPRQPRPLQRRGRRRRPAGRPRARRSGVCARDGR